MQNIIQKQCIKYLGIYLDEKLNWKNQITHVKSKISKNLGIFYKLRNYSSVNMLKQLCYTLIYPYLDYGSMSWGNTYHTNLSQLKSKQNTCVRSILFANKKESASQYFQLLGILKFENIVKLKIGLLAHKLFMNPTTVPFVFNDFLLPVTNVHNYNTRNAARYNFYRPQIRTNYGKFTFKYSASVLWESIPTCLKKISTTNGFKKQYKINLMTVV